MAKINMFEGSRRIAMLLKIVWVIGVAVVIWSSSPYVSLHFATQFPTEPFLKSVTDCDIGTDAIEFITRDIGDGKSASVQLCFVARRSDAGKQIVPYKVEASGTWWGNSPYSSEVEAYTKLRAKAFVLPEVEQRAGLDEWDRQRMTNIRNAVLFAIGGWLVLSLVQALLGWIVRGFLGIPWGKDRRSDNSAAA